MRPVLQKNKLGKKTWIIYISIFLLCIIGIGVALYISYFKNEKVGLPFGITDNESEQEDAYNELKMEFDTIFTNQLEIQQENITSKKINDQYDYVITAFEEKEENDYLSLKASIPYINVNNDVAKGINSQIKSKYKNKVDELKSRASTNNTIYTVEYKSYIQNNILSLVIRCGYKEGSQDQKLSIDTYNYNLITNKILTLNEIFALKKINEQEAKNKIKNEIKKIQEQNQPLIEQGYNFYKRDYTSEIYDITNVKQFLYGKDGMLYIIFAYGNNENTTEMDIVIFK